MFPHNQFKGAEIRSVRSPLAFVAIIRDQQGICPADTGQETRGFNARSWKQGQPEP
jgi:hypothetical protein